MLTIPPFVQYQQPLFPLRGLWNRAPAEGDLFVNIEVDWLVTTNGLTAVQFSLSGNSPVTLSQIVALAVDNSRSGADVAFVFPDSGFSLVVPAHEGGVFPVLTNALMFYAVATSAIGGDVTVFQVLNSMPPPIPISPTFQQNHVGASGIPPQTNGSTAILPAGTSGTLNTLSMSIDLVAGASAGSVQLSIVDGAGHQLWANIYNVAASTTVNYPVNVSGLDLRFTNGLNFVVGGSTNITGGAIVVNAYYSTP